MPFLVVMPRAQALPPANGYLDRLTSYPGAGDFMVSGVLFDTSTGDKYIVRWHTGGGWTNRDLAGLVSGTAMIVEDDHFWSLGPANTNDSWEYVSGAWTYYTVHTGASGGTHTHLEGTQDWKAFARVPITPPSTGVIDTWAHDGSTWAPYSVSGLGGHEFYPTYHGLHTAYGLAGEIWAAGYSQDPSTGAQWPFVAKVAGSSGFATGLYLHFTRTPPEYGQIRALTVTTAPTPEFLAVESITTTSPTLSKSSRVWYSLGSTISWVDLAPPLDGGDNLDLACGFNAQGDIWIGGSYRNAAGLYDLYVAKYDIGTTTWTRYTIPGYAVTASLSATWRPTVQDIEGGPDGADIAGNGVSDPSASHGATPLVGSLFGSVWTPLLIGAL